MCLMHVCSKCGQYLGTFPNVNKVPVIPTERNNSANSVHSAKMPRELTGYCPTNAYLVTGRESVSIQSTVDGIKHGLAGARALNSGRRK